MLWGILRALENHEFIRQECKGQLRCLGKGKKYQTPGRHCTALLGEKGTAGGVLRTEMRKERKEGPLSAGRPPEATLISYWGPEWLHSMTLEALNYYPKCHTPLLFRLGGRSLAPTEAVAVRGGCRHTCPSCKTRRLWVLCHACSGAGPRELRRLCLSPSLAAVHTIPVREAGEALLLALLEAKWQWMHWFHSNMSVQPEQP